MDAETGKAESGAELRRRIFGATVVLLGAGWIFPLLSSELPRLLEPERPGLFAMFASCFLLLILIPGALFVVLGIRIFLRANGLQVKIVVAVCLVVLMLLLSSHVAMRIAAPVADDLALLVATLAGIALFGPLVGVACAFLKLPPPQAFPSQGRGILLLPSFLLWTFLFGWLFEVEFFDPDSPWTMMQVMLRLFLPLLLTVVFYQLGVLLVGRLVGRATLGSPQEKA